ncbi:inositol monophosphatase family protein [Gordonia sp. ABSL11-1]|uniref:inositol monophosphatase family protein n=1 Tax=Gordonia sp. ABSL11-1 TaxID=3053924 RepID=UPI002572838E|nr:inositol monophosphatase family protein [Gordonia sp. ABSL11-1]MDL9947727.1 inositol monophosphatase family protein [Gordonia sp. ABSL11-1]
MTDAAGFAELERVAIDVAERAADHVRMRRPQLFGTDPGHDPRPGTRADGPAPVATKSTPTDPVTLADTETEQLIRRELREQRPDDEVLGEEAGGTVEVPSGVRWVVDPIDGTVNFMYGIPAYAVSVAAQVDGRSVAGAVVDVARAITYSASAGGGARVDTGNGPAALSCNPIDRLDLALVATGFSYGAGRRSAQGAIVADLLPRIRDLRRVGAAALDLCMVASGAVDAHYEHGLSPWDWAAGALIAAEAGAVVHTPPPQSRSSDGHVTIAAAPGIAEAFVRLLDDVGARRAMPD